MPIKVLAEIGPALGQHAKFLLIGGESVSPSAIEIVLYMDIDPFSGHSYGLWLETGDSGRPIVACKLYASASRMLFRQCNSF